MRKLLKPLTAFTLAAAALLTAGCAGGSAGKNAATPSTDSKQLTLFATTGYLADALKNIAPEAKVITMVGPGADPHTYMPTTKDISQLKDADLVFWNGLHLEAQMVQPLESLGDKQLAVGEQLDKTKLIEAEEAESPEEHYDPHIWNDPELWQQVVTMMAERIAKADDKNAAKYKENAKKYNKQIADAAAEAKTLLEAVKPPRILVTGHDAFNYFGRSFNLDVRATDFISTTASRSAVEIEELATLIAEKKIPVIFNDTQSNPQAIKSLSEAVKAKGFEVTVSGEELYADTLSAEPHADTYVEALLHNANTVAKALR